jgi:hypothetical protein
VIDFDDFDRQFDPYWRRPRRRWPTILRTVLAVVVLAVVSLVVVPKFVGLVRPGADGAQQGQAAGPPGQDHTAPGGAPSQPGLSGPSGAPAPGEAVAAAEILLRQRAYALLNKDEKAFLAGIDSRERAYRSQQQKLFRRLQKLPFAAYEYRVFPPDEALRSTRDKFAPDPVYSPLVETRYRFRRAETTPILNAVRFTFIRTPEGWRIGGQEKPRVGDHNHAELWDTGAVETLRGERTLVFFHPASRSLAQRMLDAAERGYDDVDAAWDGDWDHQVVIMVPSSESEAEKIAAVRDISAAAAVAATSTEPGPVDKILGARIVVNPAIRRYDQLNLQVVVTHEMTHVATRFVGTGVPLFLVEGFADFAALRDVDLPLRSTRPSLTSAVADGSFDGKLPSAKVFELRTANDRSRALAYDKGSTFCLWVERTWGLDTVRSLYRSFEGEDGPPSQAVTDSKFKEVLGISFATAQSRWAKFVRSNFG